jgi:hypothetical protein
MALFTEGYQQKAMEGAIDRVAMTPPSGFMESLGASFESYKFTDAGGAYEQHIVDAYDQRAAVLKQLTGEDVGNPYAENRSARLGVGTMSVEGQLSVMRGEETPAEMQERQLQEYEARVTAALDRLPDRERRMVKTRAEIEADISREAQRLEAKSAEAMANGGFGGVAGGLIGGMGAALTQPEQLATLPLGAPAKLGLVGRILAEAAIGAVTEASLQPGVQAQREQMGLESGLGEAAINIATAGAGGAVFAGGAEAARALIRGGVGAFQKRFGRPPTRDETAALQVAQQALEVEAATPYVEKGAATARVFQANQKAATAAAIEGRPVAPAEIQPAGPTRAPAPNPAGPYQVMSGEELQAIGTNAELMQFKAGGDEFGVTDRLAGITKWEPERSGVMLVYEFADGSRIIADGHQRLGLAKRLAGQGQDVQAAVMVLREQDGITPAMARARAAYKNMAEGSGSATDAAKILRDSGATLADLNLPPKSAMLRDAEGLAAVNDDVFGMVINEVIPDRFAAAIGRMVKDQLLQTNIAGLLVRLKPSTLFEAEQVIDQARRNVVAGKQDSLFGEEDVAESLYLERARLLERAQRELRRDATTFRTLLDRGSDIADAGNVLDQAANADRLATDQKVIQFIRALANRKGPIADALTEAATAAKSDGNYSRAARNFLAAVSGRIDDPEVIGAAGRGDWGGDEFTSSNGPGAQGTAAAPDLTPDEATLNMFADPTGPKAIEQTDRLHREILQAVSDTDEGFALPEVGQPVSLQKRPAEQIARIEAEFKARAPDRSIEESYIVLAQQQKRLEEVGQRLGRRKGVKFKTPGLKDIKAAREKMGRKNYSSTREMTDLVRAGFEVETPAAANNLVQTLAKSFRVLDEGWKVNGQLYFDRKVLVQFDDGTIGEVQIWNPKLLAAKEKAGHKLYTKMRKLDRASPEYAALEQQMRDLYGSAIDGLDQDWLSEVWSTAAANGGSAGELAKILPNMADETGVPDSLTSRGSAGTQPTRPLGTTNASDPDTTAGRPSQLKNDGDAAGSSATSDTPHVDTTYISDAVARAQELLTEPGAEGLPQTLLPGVDPVQIADQIALAAARGLDGSRAPGMNFGLFGDSADQVDMLDLLRSEGADLRKMEIPIGETLDVDGNKVAETQNLGELLDELAADDEFLKQLDVCNGSAT